MRFRNRAILHGATLTIPLVAAVLTVLVTAACGEGEPDVSLEPVPDAGGPDVSQPIDSGAARDANPRPPFDPTPEKVVCASEPCAVQLVAGASHFCVRMSDGTAYCWGDDIWGQLGRGEAATGLTGAGKVVELTDVVDIGAAGNVTCALLADGTPKCWGINGDGELGLSTDFPQTDYDRHPVPTRPAIGEEVAKRLDVGFGSVCIATVSGKLLCWGNGQSYKLARVVDGRGPLPVPVEPGEAELTAGMFTKTGASSRTSLGLSTDGTVWTWGAMSGEEGLVSGRISSRSPDEVPRRIDQLAKVTSLAASPILWREPTPSPGRPEVLGHAHACAIAEGEVWCWGQSFTGALCTGLPDREQEPRRAPVFSDAWPQQVTVGDETTCVRLTDGKVQCCGENINGALARSLDETFSATFTPAQNFTAHAVHVAASHGAVCALVQGGTVECWGNNTRGELGLVPDREAHPSPVTISF
jgi:alpha-tubulin suppressor-like RCC1 family protein